MIEWVFFTTLKFTKQFVQGHCGVLQWGKVREGGKGRRGEQAQYGSADW